MTANHIVIADDDKDDLELFCEAITEIDDAIICYCAHDGSDVIEKLGSNEFKEPLIIFLDINMPKMSGWQCLTALKRLNGFKHIPVIMCSASSSQTDKHTAEQLGAIYFFTKPNDYKKLKAILQYIAENIGPGLGDALASFDRKRMI